MNGTEIRAVIAALDFVEKMLPVIQQAVKAGEVSVEEQQRVRDRYNSLRNAGELAFSGPEWQVE